LAILQPERVEQLDAFPPQSRIHASDGQVEKCGNFNIHNFNIHDVPGEEAVAASHRPDTCPPVSPTSRGARLLATSQFACVKRLFPLLQPPQPVKHTSGCEVDDPTDLGKYETRDSIRNRHLSVDTSASGSLTSGMQLP
jgi:hypothetical protein